MSKHMVWKQRDQLKIPIPEGVNNAGVYRNLMNQINKIARHNRQGSFKTRDRYYEAVDRFSRHLSDHYNVQKFANINGKHLASYVEQMQTKGLSASTIKTDLAAIRFFHDKFENTRYILPDNKELKKKYGIELAQRKFGGVDRTWSEKEYRDMVSHAQSLGRENIASILKLGFSRDTCKNGSQRGYYFQIVTLFKLYRNLPFYRWGHIF
jgi:integrase/recombinase XerD